MENLTWFEILIAAVFVSACAMAGALTLIQEIVSICRDENRYGLPSNNANLKSGVLGGLAGLGVAALGIYYYMFVPPPQSWIEWVGRSSYALIVAASAAHLSLIIHIWVRIRAEERALSSPAHHKEGALLSRRSAGLNDLKQTTDTYTDLKVRDDELITDLIGVIGERLLLGHRALSRIPFYGYLGTVCGILLMAQELARLDEATETFNVLRDMANGLTLAFKTTLVALLAYLPLRKCIDILLGRVGALERAWLALRDDRGSEIR